MAPPVQEGLKAATVEYNRAQPLTGLVRTRWIDNSQLPSRQLVFRIAGIARQSCESFARLTPFTPNFPCNYQADTNISGLGHPRTRRNRLVTTAGDQPQSLSHRKV